MTPERTARFNAWYLRHERYVRRRAKSLFRKFFDNGNGRVDDALQVIFLCAFKNFDKLDLDATEDLKWLNVVTRHTVGNMTTRGFEARMINRAVADGGTDEDSEDHWEKRLQHAADPAPLAEEELLRSSEHAERLATMQAMLAELPADCRDVFVRREIKGQERLQIASETGLPLYTVTHKLNRARKKIVALGAVRGLVFQLGRRDGGGNRAAKSEEAKERQRQAVLKRWAAWHAQRTAAAA